MAGHGKDRKNQKLKTPSDCFARKGRLLCGEQPVLAAKTRKSVSAGLKFGVSTPAGRHLRPSGFDPENQENSNSFSAAEPVGAWCQAGNLAGNRPLDGASVTSLDSTPVSSSRSPIMRTLHFPLQRGLCDASHEHQPLGVPFRSLARSYRCWRRENSLNSPPCRTS